MINVHSDLIKQELTTMGVDAFAILMCITTHINAKRKAWPGIERLRKMTGLSKERTYKAIARLVELGHIERKQMNHGGEWGKVVYRLTTQYLGVYMGVSDFPLEGEEEPLAGITEHGYPEHAKPEHGFPASISIVQDGSIDKKEVLNNSNSLSTREEETFGKKNEPIPMPEHIWGQGSETSLEKAQAALNEYFQENPHRIAKIAEAARNVCDEEQFRDELDGWIRRNADDYNITQNPVKALTSGRSNFISWLSQPWCREKYLKQQQRYDNINGKGNGRVQQQRSTEDLCEPDAIKRRLGLL